FRGRRPRAPLRHYPTPSCGACPAPAKATQRRAPPGAGAFRRGSRVALGAREYPRRGVAGGASAGGLKDGAPEGAKSAFEFLSALYQNETKIFYVSQWHLILVDLSLFCRFPLLSPGSLPV